MGLIHQDIIIKTEQMIDQRVYGAVNELKEKDEKNETSINNYKEELKKEDLKLDRSVPPSHSGGIKISRNPS